MLLKSSVLVQLRVSAKPVPEKPALHAQVAALPVLELSSGQAVHVDAWALLYEPAGQTTEREERQARARPMTGHDVSGLQRMKRTRRRRDPPPYPRRIRQSGCTTQQCSLSDEVIASKRASVP